MDIFELHFNPTSKEDIISDTFCYEPENIYEKKLGSLYIIGCLKNVLPQDRKFLEELVSVVKRNFYANIHLSPEKALKQGLKKANEFLENLVKKGNTNWLGNLSIAVINLKDRNINFTKIGAINLLLLKENQIIEIDKNLKKEQETKPLNQTQRRRINWSPLKIFENLASGKIDSDDLILAMTKKVFDVFSEQNLIQEIAALSSFNGKELKNILKKKEKELLKISGVCLLISPSKEISAPERRKGIISFQEKKEKFLWTGVFKPIISFCFWIKNIIRKKIRIPKLTKPLNSWKCKIRSKNFIIVLSLIFFLSLGFFISQKEKEQQFEEYQIILNKTQEKALQAENYLIFKEKNKANILFKEAWEIIFPLTKIKSPFQEQAIHLKEGIKKNLNNLNKLEKVEEPELFFECKTKKLIPQKMIVLKKNIYLFSPYSQNLLKINISNKEQKFYSASLAKNNGLNLAADFSDSILFFSSPGKLIPFNKESNTFASAVSLKDFPDDFNSIDFSSYNSNLYFLNQKLILKYPFLKDLQWKSPLPWLKTKIPSDRQMESMAIDNNIWILNKNNSIDRYYKGHLQETINLDIFPKAKNLKKIFTTKNLPALYLLEPEHNRIIILNKQGEIIQQFQSEKFDNLLDFSICEDGKTIFLLNGLKIYQISTN